MQRTTINNKVYCLECILSYSQFNVLGDLFWFSVGVTFQIRLEALRNTPFEFENSQTFCLKWLLRVKLSVKFVFKFYWLLHRLNDEFNVDILERDTKNLVDVKFGHSTEFVSNQLVDLPVCRKQILIPISSFLTRAFEPCEPSLGFVECGIGFPWREQLFVGVQHELTVPTTKVVQCLSPDGIHY